jgi:hypothetical protein
MSDHVRPPPEVTTAPLSNLLDKLDLGDRITLVLHDSGSVLARPIFA